MKKVTIIMEDYLYDFYRKVGEQAGGIRTEKVISDALFRLAGELSLQSLKKGRIQRSKNKKPGRPKRDAPA